MSTPDIRRRLLEAIEKNPDTTQANLDAQLGVAVGSVNWYLKRLIRKGYVKVTHLQRRKPEYFVTPQGLAFKARLTSQYMEGSLRVYRKMRQSARDVLAEVKDTGYGGVHFGQDNGVAEIFPLTCLGQGVNVVSGLEDQVPTVGIDGTDAVMLSPEQPERNSESRE